MSSRSAWLRWSVGAVAVALIVAAVVGVAVARDVDPQPQPDLEARRLAAAASESAEEASGEIADLRTEIETLVGERRDMSLRLDRVTERLWAALEDLRSTSRSAADDAAAAQANVGSALAEAQAAARALAVLENRFDYHLRTDH